MAAAATADEDGSRESGELSPSQPSDVQDDSSSGDDAAAAAVAAASSGWAADAAAGLAAADVRAGSSIRRSPSPDRGSDCLSLSLGSDFGWVCWREEHSTAERSGVLLAPRNLEEIFGHIVAARGPLVLRMYLVMFIPLPQGLGQRGVPAAGAGLCGGAAQEAGSGCCRRRQRRHRA